MSRWSFRISAGCLMFILLSGCSRISSTSQQGHDETCSKCGSYRVAYKETSTHGRGVGDKYLWKSAPFTRVFYVYEYKSPVFVRCKHSWGANWKCAGGQRIADDGSVMLGLKKGTSFGILIPEGPSKQQTGMYDFAWHYRTDGKGTFRRSEARQFKSGKASLPLSGTRYPYGTVSFGPFSIEWIGMGAKYPHPSGAKLRPGDLRICRIHGEQLDTLNATQLVYCGCEDAKHWPKECVRGDGRRQ